MATKNQYSALRVVASPDGLVVWDVNRKAVPGIISVDISLRPAQPPLMRVNMVCGNFDVAGTPVFAIVDPATGAPKPVARVEFSDGTVFEAPPLPVVEADPGRAGAAAAQAANPGATIVQPAAPRGNGADPDSAPVDKPAGAE